jgi:hypothetical protein
MIDTELLLVMALRRASRERGAQTTHESLKSQARLGTRKLTWCDILCGCLQGDRLLGLCRFRTAIAKHGGHVVQPYGRRCGCRVPGAEV